MLEFVNQYAQLINVALVLTLIGTVIRVSQLVTSVVREQSNLYKAQLDVAKSQSPLPVAEDLNRRVEITEGELERQRSEIEQLRSEKLEKKEQIVEAVMPLIRHKIQPAMDALRQSTETALQKSREQVDETKHMMEKARKLVLTSKHRREIHSLLVQELGRERLEEILGKELMIYLAEGSGDD